MRVKRFFLYLFLCFFLFLSFNVLSATRIVNSLIDGTVGSLRYEIENADSGDFIMFHPDTIGQKIILFYGEIDLEKDVSIVGNGATRTEIIVYQNSHSRAFNVHPLVNALISKLTIRGGYISGNSDPQNQYYGGAIYSRGNLVLQDLLLAENSVGYVPDTPHWGRGGAVYHQPYNDQSGDFYMNNVSVVLNQALEGAGIFIGASNADASVKIENSMISANVANSPEENPNGEFGAAGGIGVHYPTTVTNTTISWNQADLGGGVVYTDEFNCNYCTIAFNRATNKGGGIFGPVVSHFASFYGSLIANNSDITGFGPDLYSYKEEVVYAMNSLIGSTIGANLINPEDNLINIDPLLSPSFSFYHNPNIAKLNFIAMHKFNLNSPARNAISHEDCVDNNNNLVITDQRGHERPIESACDMGAYERQVSED